MIRFPENIRTHAKDIKCWNCGIESQLNYFKTINIWLCDECSKKAYNMVKRIANKRPRWNNVESFINAHNLRELEYPAEKVNKPKIGIVAKP